MKFLGITIPFFSRTVFLRTNAAPPAGRDWSILVVCSLVLLIIVCVWSAYVFLGVQTGDIFQTAVSTAARPVLDRTKLHDMQQVYAARTQAFSTNTIPPALSDPSR